MLNSIRKLFAKRAQEVYEPETIEAPATEKEDDDKTELNQQPNKQERLILRVLNEIEPKNYSIKPDDNSIGVGFFYKLNYDEGIELCACVQHHFGCTTGSVRLCINGKEDAFTMCTDISLLVQDKVYAMRDYWLENKHYKIEDILEKKQ